MPDIAMCKNEACPLRHECYRYMAVPSYWQSYTIFDEKEAERCFWPIEDRQIREEEHGETPSND